MSNRLAGIGYWRARNARWIGLALFAALIVVSGAAAPVLQDLIGPHLTDARLATLQMLFVTLGGSMLGATAIGFSIVMLAVQLNFARIPHALFRKLSQDPRLIGTFAMTFCLAILLGALSMVPSVAWAAPAIIVGLWIVALTLVLFLNAFRRALDLINPIVQLRLVAADVEKAMKTWGRLARRTTPLLETRQTRGVSQDIPRVLFLNSNPQWAVEPKRALTYSVSFARRYAEQGEYEVSGFALATIVAVNSAYIDMRGKTFFAPNPMVNNPFSNDAFINETLEQLRMLALSASSRGDEGQITQIMGTTAALVGVYSKIDYGRDYGVELHHCQLAASYLNGMVEGAVQRFGPDVLMEGIRLLGQSASILIQKKRSIGVVTLAQKISTYSLVGLVRPNFEPVTSTGVELLAKLTFSLIRSEEQDVGYALREVRSAVKLVTLATISTADTSFRSGHSRHMAAYFSMAQAGTFSEWMTGLANTVVAAPAGDKTAQRVIRHIEAWSDQIYEPLKESLLAALKQNSGLVFDLITWICHFAGLISVLSTAPSAGSHSASELVRNANWLLWVLDWIPSEKEAISFAENSQLTEHVFEAAVAAFDNEVPDVVEAARGVLLNWAFKAGRHQTGWPIFERALTALAVLSVWKADNQEAENLPAKIGARLAKDVAFPVEERKRTAAALREKSRSLDDRSYYNSAIEQAAMGVDRKRLELIFIEIADTLSPKDT